MKWELCTIELTISHDRVIAKARVRESARHRTIDPPGIMVSYGAQRTVEQAAADAVASMLKIAGLSDA